MIHFLDLGCYMTTHLNQMKDLSDRFSCYQRNKQHQRSARCPSTGTCWFVSVIPTTLLMAACSDNVTSADTQPAVWMLRQQRFFTGPSVNLERPFPVFTSQNSGIQRWNTEIIVLSLNWGILVWSYQLNWYCDPSCAAKVLKLTNNKCIELLSAWTCVGLLALGESSADSAFIL